MKQICKKLKSEHGASFLLALLLFLICVMVGTSVLTAATSNASRIRYQQKEEQACLAVSSALRCVVDELLETTYYGQYTITGESDKVYDQKTCALVVETEEGSESLSQMRTILKDDLDNLFGQYMWNLNVTGDHEKKEYHNRGAIKKPEHSLVTAVENMEGMEDYEVTIRLTVHDSYSIDLTAELTGAPKDSQDCIGYEMNAELTPGKTPPQLELDESEGDHRSTPMTWTLGKITGKELTD